MAMEVDSGPRPKNRSVVFRLEPLNPAALSVAKHHRNRQFVSSDGPRKIFLDIGGVPSAVNDGVTLATLGRQGDIYIDDTSVARVQCSFEISTISKLVMLCDMSHHGSTQVHELSSRYIKPNQDKPAVFPFEHGRPRKVCVGPLINPVLGMCGPNRDRILFRLVWENDHPEALKCKVLQYDTTHLGNHLARTLDDTETAPETTRTTRMHTPALGDSMIIRYYKQGVLGEGSFGIVHRVLNVDTGRVMALKQLKRRAVSVASWKTCQREVDILAKVEHPHIVDLIWSQHWDQEEAEIFLGIKDGALHSLVLSGSYAPSLQVLTELVFDHMLQALDALAYRGIIHRDVKPENILYLYRAGEYQFQLSDFGLSNHEDLSTSHQPGTKIFMAPEMYSGKGRQSHKADVWSLLVTLVWTLDVDNFRTFLHRASSYEQIFEAVNKTVADKKMCRLQPMAAHRPEQRASAAQMLCACFGGKGLTTPRNQVPELQLSLPPSFALPQRQRQPEPEPEPMSWSAA